ncbi:hypothetical protein [Marinimicrococcus flavescens]|uniref:Uncharacterized protein n=1 Tax=Marinimicrococcus flavescens TaxID=3031815 RepID=A0AAP3UYZ0_9PROT|nr:hypothetical protein [Marinimicrococcus flavescens]
MRELAALREQRPAPAARGPGPDMSARIARMEAEAAAYTTQVMGWLLAPRAGRGAMPGMNEPGRVAAPAADRAGRPRTEVLQRQTQRA